MTKRNLEGLEITDQGLRNYVLLNLGEFVLKIVPNQVAKFGSARNILYLCIVKSEE